MCAQGGRKGGEWGGRWGYGQKVMLTKIARKDCEGYGCVRDTLGAAFCPPLASLSPSFSPCPLLPPSLLVLVYVEPI